MAFDLTGFVRVMVRAAPSSVDLRAVAIDVYHRIPVEDRDSALKQALQVFVPHTVTRDRTSFAPVVIPQPEATPALSLPQNAKQAFTPSRKVSDIRSAWKEVLRERYTVARNCSKELRECTVDDLEYAAKLRDNQAVWNAKVADKLRALIKIINENGVTKVGELSDDALSLVYGSAA